ncbi:MAG: gamma-glutamyl-phosphate reductase, partial [Sphingomonadaceae bacterium]|nr:gamma-glutamyl-phosphate reductase [Sphingomonadaceae bacterium]
MGLVTGFAFFRALCYPAKMPDFLPPDQLIAKMGQRARVAAAALALSPTTQKAQALKAAAAQLRADAAKILAANAQDMSAGAAMGLSAAMLDRLKLDEGRIEAIAAGVDAVAQLPDPVGQIIDETQRPNGLKMSRVRVPLGVIG